MLKSVISAITAFLTKTLPKVIAEPGSKENGKWIEQLCLGQQALGSLITEMNDDKVLGKLLI